MPCVSHAKNASGFLEKNSESAPLPYLLPLIESGMAKQKMTPEQKKGFQELLAANTGPDGLIDLRGGSLTFEQKAWREQFQKDTAEGKISEAKSDYPRVVMPPTKKNPAYGK